MNIMILIVAILSLLSFYLWLELKSERALRKNAERQYLSYLKSTRGLLPDATISNIDCVVSNEHMTPEN